MPEITDSQLMKNIRQGQIDPVYFFYGKELLLLHKALSALLKKVVTPGMESFNLQKFDSDKTTVEEIENAAEALPVMAERKCVVVQNLNIEKLPAAQSDRLKALLKDPPPSTVLIFAVTAFEVSPKKSAKVKAFCTAVSKVGSVVEFALKDKSALCRALCERAAKKGSTLSPKNASLLVERCGQSLTVLYNELDKLCDFAAGEEITAAHIQQSVTPTVDSSAFDLAKAVLRGQNDRALSLLGELFYQKIEPVVILGALNMSMIDLYRAKAGGAEGKKAPDITADFGYKKNVEFRVRNALNDSSKMSMPHLRACIEALYQTDAALKSTGADGRILLEQLVVTMLAARR